MSYSYIIFAVWLHGAATAIPLPAPKVPVHIKTEEQCERIVAGLVEMIRPHFEDLKRVDYIDGKCFTIHEESI